MTPSPPRRIEALAYIVERITRSGTSPSYGEIARAMRPPVHRSRAREYVDQLVLEGFLGRQIASRRGIGIADAGLCKAAIANPPGVSLRMGDAFSSTIVSLSSTSGPAAQIPPFEHMPDPD